VYPERLRLRGGSLKVLGLPLAVAAAAGEPGQHEVAVGDERPHVELLGRDQGLADRLVRA
jgi:hypothetical protein